MSVCQLPHGVIKLISSTQVISSLASVVKELVENSIDAGATVIDIKLEKHGLQKIEVRDNGSGINTTDIRNVCLPNFTSKIYSLDDLESLRSYGFRGEALNSLCAVSQVSITTRTESDDIASTYTYDNNGTVREIQPSHQMKGTIVSATDIFKNVPVRKQYYENTKKGNEELKKIEKITKLLSVIHPKLKVTLAHNKCLIWQKTSVYTLRQSLMQMYPHVVLKNLVEFSTSFGEMSIEMLICKRDCNWSVLCQPLSEAVLFFINRRPVKDKKVEKVVLEEMTHLFASTLPPNKCPLTLISMSLPTENLDVNVEPDKSRVFIKNHEEVLKQIRECIMLHFYEQPLSSDKGDSETAASDLEENANPKKRKLDDIEENSSEKKLVFEAADFIPANSNLNCTTNGDVVLLENETNPSVIDLADIESPQLEENSVDLQLSLQLSPVRKVPEEISQSEEISQLEERTMEGINSQSDDIVNDISADLFETQLQNSEDEKIDKELNANASVDYSNDSEADRLLDFISQENWEFLPNKENRENAEFSTSNENVNSDTSNTEANASKNLSQTTLSQWSKGIAKFGNQQLQGGVNILHGCEAKKEKNEKEIPPKKKLLKPKSSEEEVTEDTMERSVSSQMGRKDLAGLTNFARTIRSEIIKENPGITFTGVATELADRWRKLGDDQKNVYAERAKASKIQKPPLPETKPKQFVKKKRILLNISIADIISSINESNKVTSSKDIRLIGSLDTKTNRLCRIGGMIAAISIPRLQENVLYHRYLCHSAVPMRHLDRPIKITVEVIGSELWQFLLSLQKSHCRDSTNFIISDCRVANNGFKIVVHEESDRCDFLIDEIADALSYSAVENLLETLRLMTLHEDLLNCRTLIVKRLLKEDAMNNLTDNPNEKEIEADLLYWVKNMSAKQILSEEKPVMVKLQRL